MSATRQLVLAGVGGQGVFTAGTILADALVDAGFHLMHRTTVGMSQRGGAVCAFIRYGALPLSPHIDPGSADFLVAFEPAEALRWHHYLRPGGVVIANNAATPPPVVASGHHPYPASPLASLRERRRLVVEINATEIARHMNDLRLVSPIMLGVISSFVHLPSRLFERILRERFSGNAEVCRRNLEAFAAGTRSQWPATGQATGTDTP